MTPRLCAPSSKQNRRASLLNAQLFPLRAPALRCRTRVRARSTLPTTCRPLGSGRKSPARSINLLAAPMCLLAGSSPYLNPQEPYDEQPCSCTDANGKDPTSINLDRVGFAASVCLRPTHCKWRMRGMHESAENLATTFQW